MALNTPFTVPATQVVNVSITKQQILASLYNFGLVCLFTENTTVLPVSTRIITVNNLADVVAAGFNSSSAEYAWAAEFFAQSPTPTVMAIACVNTAASETYPTAIAAAYAITQFYAVAVVSLVLTDMVLTAIAAYVQTQLMLFMFVSAEAGIITSGTSDIAATLQAASYYRTIPCWDDTNNITLQRFDACWLGAGITQQAGTYNWAMKQLAGLVASATNTAGQNFGLTKACNFYTQIGASNANPVGSITRYGTTSFPGATFYIDEVQTLDYIQIGIQQVVLQLLLSVNKVPYTDAGVASMIGVIKNFLDGAVDAGILSASPAPVVSAPLVSSVSPSTKAARTAPTISFSATFSGAINTVTINGILNY